jgi:hypothetical protein
MQEPAVVVLVACALALALLVGGAEVGVRETVQPEAATETLTVNFSAPQPLSNGSERFGYEDDERVTVNGDRLEESTDYDFNATNGTVSFFDTGNITAGETATVDYRFRAPPQRVQQTTGLIAGVLEVLGVLLWPLIGGLILVVISRL